jgi:hypothetical protein
MKLLTSLALAACLFSTQVMAEEVKPSDASLQELLQIVHAEDLLKAVDQQMDSVFQSTMQQVTQGKPPTPAQQKELDNFRGKMKAIMHEEFNWQEMQPEFMQVYRQTLSQEEVDGMIAFYKTPTGQAVIKKMPLIMQASMGMVQKKFPVLMQKIQQAAKESFKEQKSSK